MKFKEIPPIEYVVQEVSNSGSTRDKIRELCHEENSIRHGKDYLSANPRPGIRVRVIKRTITDGKIAEYIVWPKK